MLPQVEPIVAHTTVVMTLAIFGNLLLGLMILNRPKKKGSPKRRISRVQILLLHTCVADLLFALFSLGTEDLILITYPYFYGPDCICKLTRFLQAFPLYASPFLLVAISVDRYQAICRPLTTFGRHRYRRPHGLALVAWIAAILCSIPQIFVWHKTHPVYGQCATVYGRGSSTLKSIYVICFNSMAWLLPSVVSGYFYYKVCNAVWYSGRTLDRLPPYINTVGSLKKTSTENLSCHTQDYVNRLRTKSLGFRNQTSRFDQKRIQTVRLTLTIIVCNFVLWAPFCLINILQAFAPQALSSTMITYIVILGNLNSCVNPWIYILFNCKFRNFSAKTAQCEKGVKITSEPVNRCLAKTSSKAMTRSSSTTSLVQQTVQLA